MCWSLSFLILSSVQIGVAQAALESHEGYKKPQSTIKLKVLKIEDQGVKKRVQIQLTKIKDNMPVTLEDLKEIHSRKIHILIIDDALEDYSHVHPEALKEPGTYEFDWKPKTQGNYRMWADLLPISTQAQEYAEADLTLGQVKKSDINRKTILESQQDGYHFKLSFEDESLAVGTPTMGKIVVTDSQGNPVKDLEPLMGAFAHIVGFSEDLKTVVHIHPMGEEPSKPTDRGGPDLEFHLQPEAQGFIKLFAQVNIKGKEIFAPFGVTVK